MRKRASLFTTVPLLFILTVSALAGSIVEKIGNPANQITVIYLKGSPYRMGYIQGSVLKPEIRAMYDSLLASVSHYGSLALLDIAYKQLEPYIPQAYKEEMQGLADGAGVDVQTVHRVHAIPDVSEMDCSFFAAWGNATADGNLYQIRALDYATEWHLQEHPVILVCEPDSGRRFVNVGWAGFIGVVSGMNYDGLAVSEIGESFDKAHQTMAAEPMPFVLRDVLQYGTTLKQAVAIISGAYRTSSFLYCVGDAKIPEARSFKTSPTVCEVYSDSTSPNPFLEDVVYFSMGVSSHWNADVYNFLRPFHGNIDAETGKKLMQTLGTGSLHAVVYDPAHLKIWVANAGVDQTPAYKRVFVEYDLSRADSIFANYAVTGVEKSGGNRAVKFQLFQNYPNPFNPVTRIDFLIPEIATGQSSVVELTIFDVTGQKIKTLEKGAFAPGHYHRIWNGCTQTGRQVPSGLYFLQLRIGEQSQTRRMLLLR